MSNPRIYIVIATFLPLVGGAERQALLLGRSLRERDHATTIITFRHDITWPAYEVLEGVPIIRVAGTILERRKKLPRIFQKLLYLIAMGVMGWTLWRHRRYYDIVHVYMLNLLAMPASIVCRLTGKSMIVAIRCADSGKKTKPHQKTSLLAGSLDPSTPWLQIEGRTWEEGDLAELELMGRPVVRFTNALLQRINAVAVILSSRMRGYLAEHDFNLSDIQLIPNGVDIARFIPLPADASFNERAKVVICVSKFRFQKGIDVLLQAWNLVHQQAPEARLIIVGNGPLQNQLEQMNQALGLTGCVEFVGLQKDVPLQLHRAGLAVLSSYWEGMPNAILEAMASGLPCVATRVSGSEDIISQGVNGLLVEPGDYEGLAQALLALLNNPKLIQQYGQAARATIEQNFSLEYILNSYIELYQRIVNRQLRITKDIHPSKSTAYSVEL
jgi:glycosyltransferase involved in cell wall biosynthesis